MSGTVIENKDPKVSLELTVNELNVILTALQELPHRAVDSLLKNILAQAQEQLKTS